MKKLIVALGAVMIMAAAVGHGHELSAGKFNLVALAEQSAARNAPLLLESKLPSGTEYAAACCKVCNKGKACGDSCIARDKQCHQPPGCACDSNN
jgi:hypothetical protein